MPQQEKQLFDNPKSKRFWTEYFKTLGYSGFNFLCFPKQFSPHHKKQTYIKKILDRRLHKLLKVQIHDSGIKIKVKVIITGDHDEIKNENILLEREKLASEIKERLLKYKPIIILKREKSFKIEAIMEAISGLKINKSILRKKLGTETPAICDLINCEDAKELANAIGRLKKSAHPLFLELAKKN